MGAFEDYMVLEMGQRPAIIRGAEATGDPNASANPKVQNAPSGTFYLQNDSNPKALWQKRGDTPDTWVKLGAGTNYSSRVIVVGPSEQYTTIQAGVDAASDGDVIQVMPGTYNLSAPVSISKQVTIVGNVNYSAGVTIVAPNLGALRNAFTVNMDYVSISGVTFTGAGTISDGDSAAILVNGDFCYIGSCTFSSNINGILITGTGCKVEDSEFTGSTIDLTAVNPQHTGCGIWVDCADTGSGFFVQKSKFVMNQKAGIKFDGEPNIAGDKTFNVSAIIDGNYFAMNRPLFGATAVGQGIDITPGVSGITIKNNTFDDHSSMVGAYFSNKSAGIRANNTTEVVIESNVFKGNLSGVLYYADSAMDITKASTGNVIRENKFRDNNRGITIGDGAIAWGSSDLPVIKNNEFEGNNLTDLVSEGIDSMGIYNNTSSQTIDARGNYWGDPSGPEDDTYGDGVILGSGDAINSSFLVEPFITRGNRASDMRNDSSVAGKTVKDALEAVGSVTSKSFQTLYVDAHREGAYTANGSITAPYKSIRAAVDVAVADLTIKKIVIHRGLYQENLILNGIANLSFVAAPGEDVILGGAGTRPLRCVDCSGLRFEGIYFYNSGAVTPTNGIELNGVSNSEFHNCKIVGRLNGIELTYDAGNAANATELTFIDCEIIGTDGIGLFSQSGLFELTTFENCQITGKEGSTVVFGYDDIKFNDCHLEATAPANIDSCGAMFGASINQSPANSSGLTIQNCSIMGCYQGVAPATGTAVLRIGKEGNEAIGSSNTTTLQNVKIMNWGEANGIYLNDNILDTSSFVASDLEFLTTNYTTGMAVNSEDNGMELAFENCWWGHNLGPNVQGSPVYDGPGGIIQDSTVNFTPWVVKGSRGSDFRNDSSITGETITDALNNLSSIAGSGSGGVFITDVQPHNVGKSVSITYATGLAVNGGYNVVESIVTDDNEVDVTVMAYGAGDAWQPEVTINAGGAVVLTMQTGRQRQFEGSQSAIALGAGELIARTNQGNTHEVTVTIQAGPDTTSVLIGALPGTQTAAKSGDSIDVTGTTSDYNAGDEVRLVDQEAFIQSAWVPVVDNGDGTGTFTISGTVSVRLGGGNRAYVEARNKFGAVGAQGVSGNSITLDQSIPSFTFISLTYPVGQGALKGSETADIVLSPNQVGASPVYLFESPNGDLSIPDPALFSGSKTLTRIAGDYNDSVVNFRCSVLRSENGASALYEHIVEIANVAPVIGVSLPAARLRSDLVANGGADHTITVTADQKLNLAPVLNASSAVRGRLTGIADSGNQKIWTGTMNVDDADEKGVFAWQGLTAVNKAGISTTTITTGGSYTLGGFLPRTITWTPGFNRIQPLGVRCADFSKLSAQDNNTNTMTHQTTDLADENMGTPSYLYTVTDGAQAILATPNVNIDNYLYWTDTFSAQTNSTGTATITVEEAV